MTLPTQPYKGSRDFYPEDKSRQNYIFGVMRSVAEKYGYQEYDAPLLEPMELYTAKSGDEIVNDQTYTFLDRGGRQVVIRPEMTPSVSRMVAAKRQELPYPLRLYSIPNLWRYERPQRGRLREHWQLNVDLFGVAGIEAEHEIVTLANDILRTYGAKPSMYTIRLNSRQFMDYMLRDYLGLGDVQHGTMTRLIDRYRKIPHAEFTAQAEAIFTPSQRQTGNHQRFMDILAAKDMADLPPELADNKSLGSLKQLISMLRDSGISNAVFDITLMRGFDYYTDIVFEVFDTDPSNNRSLFGGGRYDGLVGLFGAEPLPTIGFGVGDVTLGDFLSTHGLLPSLDSTIDACVVMIGDVYKDAQSMLHELRQEGLKLAVDMTNRKPTIKIKHAVKLGVRYVIFIGESELQDGRFTLKDLQSGEEIQASPQRLVATIKDFRREQD